MKFNAVFLSLSFSLTAIISLATTTIKYTAGDQYMLSFQPNKNVNVLSKSAGTNPNVWGCEIGGRRGYVPKNLLIEKKMLKKAEDLIYEVDTELTEDLAREALAKQAKVVEPQPKELPTIAEVPEPKEPSLSEVEIPTDVDVILGDKQLDESDGLADIETNSIDDTVEADAEGEVIDDESKQEAEPYTKESADDKNSAEPNQHSNSINEEHLDREKRDAISETLNADVPQSPPQNPATADDADIYKGKAPVNEPKFIKKEAFVTTDHASDDNAEVALEIAASTADIVIKDPPNLVQNVTLNSAVDSSKQPGQIETPGIARNQNASPIETLYFAGGVMASEPITDQNIPNIIDPLVKTISGNDSVDQTVVAEDNATNSLSSVEDSSVNTVKSTESQQNVAPELVLTIDTEQNDTIQEKSATLNAAETTETEIQAKAPAPEEHEPPDAQESSPNDSDNIQDTDAEEIGDSSTEELSSDDTPGDADIVGDIDEIKPIEEQLPTPQTVTVPPVPITEAAIPVPPSVESTTPVPTADNNVDSIPTPASATAQSENATVDEEVKIGLNETELSASTEKPSEQAVDHSSESVPIQPIHDPVQPAVGSNLLPPTVPSILDFQHHHHHHHAAHSHGHDHHSGENAHGHAHSGESHQHGHHQHQHTPPNNYLNPSLLADRLATVHPDAAAAISTEAATEQSAPDNQSDSGELNDENIVLVEQAASNAPDNAGSLFTPDRSIGIDESLFREPAPAHPIDSRPSTDGADSWIDNSVAAVLNFVNVFNPSGVNDNKHRNAAVDKHDSTENGKCKYSFFIRCLFTLPVYHIVPLSSFNTNKSIQFV